MKTKLFIFGIPALIVWFILSTIIYAKISDSSNKVNGQSPEGIACAYIKRTYAKGFYEDYEKNKGSDFYYLGSFYIDATDKQIKEVLTSIYEYKLGLNRIPPTQDLNYDFVVDMIGLDLYNAHNSLKRACINKYGLASINGLN
jgi:hypothetical protein